MIDSFITQFDKALRTLFVTPPLVRPMPGGGAGDALMSDDEKQHAAALMRVNHVGEVCAQALYQGQALTCKDGRIRAVLEHAAAEESEHLAWTERRIKELGSRTSLLNPLWYLGALTIGAVAGKCGDAWSLGFLAETERQVEDHLEHHLDRLPAVDTRSAAIVAQMKLDEIAHAETAVELGARELPEGVRAVMRGAAAVMTGTAYYL